MDVCMCQQPDTAAICMHIRMLDACHHHHRGLAEVPIFHTAQLSTTEYIKNTFLLQIGQSGVPKKKEKM